MACLQWNFFFAHENKITKQVSNFVWTTHSIPYYALSSGPQVYLINNTMSPGLDTDERIR